MGKKRIEETPSTPGAYAAGVVTLILMAVVGLWLSALVMNMTPAAWGFSGFASFGAAILGGPVWLAVGIWCLVASGKASEWYRTDLMLLGVLNILGIIFTAFFPLFYKSMLLVWFICYGLVFGCLIYLAYCRSLWRSGKRKGRVSRATQTRMEKVEAGLGKVSDVTGSVGTWLGKAMIVTVLVVGVVMIGLAVFALLF